MFILKDRVIKMSCCKYAIYLQISNVTTDKVGLAATVFFSV